MQTRDLALGQAQLKFQAGKTRTFSGYASVFNGVDAYGDTILPGAYKDSLAKRRPMFFYGHNPGRVLGKWVETKEDDVGLYVTGEFTPGHSDADDVYASLKHEALSGLSIGYVPLETEDTEQGRILKKIDLFEISIVSMPADDEARVDAESVKATIDTLSSIRDCEFFLRDAGNLSRSASAAFVSRIKAITQGDPAEVAEMKKQLAEKQQVIDDLRVDLLIARHPIPNL
jgi:HK97 family phage prohead protease